MPRGPVFFFFFFSFPMKKYVRPFLYILPRSIFWFTYLQPFIWLSFSVCCTHTNKFYVCCIVVSGVCIQYSSFILCFFGSFLLTLSDVVSAGYQKDYQNLTNRFNIINEWQGIFLLLQRCSSNKWWSLADSLYFIWQKILEKEGKEKKRGAVTLMPTTNRGRIVSLINKNTKATLMR